MNNQNFSKKMLTDWSIIRVAERPLFRFAWNGFILKYLFYLWEVPGEMREKTTDQINKSYKQADVLEKRNTIVGNVDASQQKTTISRITNLALQFVYWVNKKQYNINECSYDFQY